MQEVRRRLQIFLTLFLLVTAIGTTGFMVLEKISFAEAFYYNIVTMSTVGYGDIHPTSQASRMFAVLLIVMGGATFLGVIANATEILILKRESRNRTRKVNMVLGVFFSEVGHRLLCIFSSHDHTINGVIKDLTVASNWSEARFATALKDLKRYKAVINAGEFDLTELHLFLNGRRDFLLGLLENPVLIEHEGFSDTLLSVFHVLDELTNRNSLTDLPQSDINHLTGDITRAYKKLIVQWIIHMGHLKREYPYLFSLALRTNPFDKNASPVVMD
ncbi:MAG: two pore domain potassium channel family protein [Desulfobacteraceae bacterium]|nr:two pore domain potassium channel family protein [Desulfobacteraceae bacterium]